MAGMHAPGEVSGERAEILQMLAAQRETLLITVRGLDDAEAATRTTVSDLTLGGIVKHLAQGHRAWTHILAGREGTPQTKPCEWLRIWAVSLSIGVVSG